MEAIQRETTRQRDWKAPAEEELTDAAHLEFSQSVPYLAQVKKRGAKMRRHMNMNKWKITGWKDYAPRTESDSGLRPGGTVPHTLDKPSSKLKLPTMPREEGAEAHEVCPV